jgi:hypothetical protein
METINVVNAKAILGTLGILDHFRHYKFQLLSFEVVNLTGEYDVKSI